MVRSVVFIHLLLKNVEVYKPENSCPKTTGFSCVAVRETRGRLPTAVIISSILTAVAFTCKKNCLMQAKLG